MARWIAVSSFAAFAGLSHAASARECSLVGVAGPYGYTSTGSIVTPAVGPFAAAGSVTLTRNGTFSGEQTASIAGNAVAETFNGTYTVNSDCTGSATAYVYHGTTLARTTVFNVVWDDNQKEYRAVFLTAGTVITMTGRRMFYGIDGSQD
jgi:hypothetical protein